MMELDGRPVTADALATLGLHNYGHFTTMLVGSGKVRGLSLHLRRLVTDCRTLFDHDLDTEVVRALVRRVLVRPASGDPAGGDPSGGDPAVVVRVTVFAPELEPSGPAQAVRPSILVTTRPQADRGLPPLRLRSVRYQRDIPHVKHVGLCGTRYHRRAAQLAGADDVLFVDDRGGICEGATWNIGFADGDRLVWPDARCLPGVTMGLLKSLDAPASTTAGVNLASAAAMGAAFVTNAVVGVRPVQLIDDVRYDPGAEVLRQLREAYLAIPGEDL